MRVFLRLLLIFALAVGLAVLARFNPGNVVIFYPPYRVDLSLNLVLLLAAAAFVFLYLLLRALRVAREMPGRVIAYRRGKRDRESNHALRDALKGLFEGRFGQAEKAANRAAAAPDNAGLAALIAARAAHRMREYERRDVWLASAEADPSMKGARLMTTLDLLVDEHRYERALETVEELNASGTRHVHALRLALKANQHAKNWPEVLRLVRVLDKHRALHPALSSRLRELAYDDLLDDRSRDAESLRRLWSEIPAQDRVVPHVAVRAARAFNLRGLHDDARLLLEKALANDWDERLVRAYRQSACDEGSPGLLAQIEHAEQWLERHPADPELALALGAFCLRQKLWGKAQHHLERAVADAAEPETLREAHLKLAQLHEALSQPEQAAAHYRHCALALML